MRTMLGVVKPQYAHGTNRIMVGMSRGYKAGDRELATLPITTQVVAWAIGVNREEPQSFAATILVVLVHALVGGDYAMLGIAEDEIAGHEPARGSALPLTTEARAAPTSAPSAAKSG